jgi:hypothetical protein
MIHVSYISKSLSECFCQLWFQTVVLKDYYAPNEYRTVFYKATVQIVRHSDIAHRKQNN